MKFIIDNHLPPSLASAIEGEGHEAIHARDIEPLGERTTDEIIVKIAAKEGRAVISKDEDYVRLFRAAASEGKFKLLRLEIDNALRREIIRIFVEHFSTFVKLLEAHDFVVYNYEENSVNSFDG